MAVKVKEEPAFSAIEVADVANVTVGALSFSIIVIVGVFNILKFPNDPALSTVIIIVSFPS